MLRNKISEEEKNERKIYCDMYECKFDFYIKKRYFYCGGNNNEHLIFFRCIYPGQKTPSYPCIEDAYCYICGFSLCNVYNKYNPGDSYLLWEPSPVFYIKDYKKYNKDDIKIIGRCCLNRVYGSNEYKKYNEYKTYKTYKMKID